MACIEQELVGKVEVHEIDVEKLSPAKVVDEIFDSILREIVSEVNVPLESLSEPVLIGVARNTTSAGRPSSEYYVR
jgi:broad-specificity NMP kinase